MTWHVDPPLLQRYADDSRSLTDPVAASIETHLISCTECRAFLAEHSIAQETAMQWDAIADVIDRPTPSLAERFVRALGIDEGAARLAGASAPLQLRWLAAVIAVTAAAVWFADRPRSPGAFLLIAPLVPVGSVAVAFLGLRDPAGEAGVVTPTSGLRLALRRAVVVLTSTLVVLSVGALSLPGLAAAHAAWVLPALALSTAAVALSTWVTTEAAAATAVLGWLLVVGALQGSTARGFDDRLVTAPAQLVALTCLAAAAAVAIGRRDRLPIGALV